MEIYNSTGMIIHSELISGNTYYGSTAATHLPAGIYIIHLKGNGKKIVRKLIIN